MAVYSSVIPNERIVENVRKSNASNILIIACGGCTNESLAYANKLPLFMSRENESLEESILLSHAVPYAAKTVAERIAVFLSNGGYNVNLCIVPLGAEMLCIQRDDSIGTFSYTDKADIVLALCCPAGVVGIKRHLKGLPVVPLMIPEGQLFYVYKDFPHSREIIYEESYVLK